MNKVTTRRKKQYYSDAEKKVIVDKFLSSEMSKANFCKQENISTSALYRWQKELPLDNNNDCAFIPVKSNSAVASTAQLLQIKLSHGTEIFIPEGFSIVYVTKLIKELA